MWRFWTSMLQERGTKKDEEQMTQSMYANYNFTVYKNDKVIHY